VRKVIEPLLDKGVDRVVLGCTHYPFLRSEIERVIGGRDIQVIDSGEAVARRVEWLLERYDIAASRDNTPTFEFVTFGDDEYLQRLRRRGERIGGLR
jgi:glutamate racemase